MAGQAATIEDLNGLMRLMMKSAIERMLDTEMEFHLGQNKDSKQVVRDLKKIHQAATVIKAEEALDKFAQTWDE